MSRNLNDEGGAVHVLLSLHELVIIDLALATIDEDLAQEAGIDPADIEQLIELIGEKQRWLVARLPKDWPRP